ncbi:MAG: hypothetical protein Q9197_003713 [Variospora fuerteventurae]
MNAYLGGGGGDGGGGRYGDNYGNGFGGRQADPYGDPHGGAAEGAAGGGYAADPWGDQYGGVAGGAGAGQYPDSLGGAATGGRTPGRQYAAPPAGDLYGGGQLVSRSGGAANAGQGNSGAQGDPYAMPDNNAFGGGGYDGMPAGGSGTAGGSGGGGGGLAAQRGQFQQLWQPPANAGGMTMREAETALIYGRGATSSRSWHGGGNGVKLDQLAPALAPVLSCPPGHLPGPWHILGALVLGKNHFSCEGTNHTSHGQCEGQFRMFLMRQCRHRGYNGPAEPGLVMRFVGPWVVDIRQDVEGNNRRASMVREPRARYAEPRPRRLLLARRRL